MSSGSDSGVHWSHYTGDGFLRDPVKRPATAGDDLDRRSLRLKFSTQGEMFGLPLGNSSHIGPETGWATQPNQLNPFKPQTVLDDIIWFRLEPSFQDDTELSILYENALELAIVKMVRDLQAVTLFHLNSIQGVDVKLSPLMKHVAFKTISPLNPISSGISEVIKAWTNLQDGIISILEKSPTLVQNGWKPIGENVFSNWSPNNMDLYVSNLVNRYTCMKQTIPQQIIEITLPPREALFKDVGGFVVLRGEMRSLDNGVSIVPAVVNAWGRVLLNSWKDRSLLDRTCLGVLENDGLTRESDLLKSWDTWIIGATEGPLEEKELVFIPIHTRYNYTLLVLNFKDMEVHCIDTAFRHDRSAWEDLASFLLRAYCKFLQTKGKPRILPGEPFIFKLMNPRWSSTSLHHPDSGVSVMHVMATYATPGAPTINECLSEEHVRLKLRIWLCSKIAMNKVNILQPMVLSAARRFAANKSSLKVAEDEEVKKFRGMLDWMPTI